MLIGARNGHVCDIWSIGTILSAGVITKYVWTYFVFDQV